MSKASVRNRHEHRLYRYRRLESKGRYAHAFDVLNRTERRNAVVCSHIQQHVKLWNAWNESSPLVPSFASLAAALNGLQNGSMR